ncbi:manganese efflux pump MntP [Yoonia sp.]|uniref:manganese efflux pump MntP n=1 Tax=Yoonia sp. TaxID=2212373 RepID=UPI003F6D06FA
MIMQLFLLGVVIGANNFATALTLGALGHEIRRWRIILMFGLFEFWVPLIGLWLGRNVSALVVMQTDWFRPLLLAGLGLWIIFQLLHSPPDKRIKQRWLSSWRGLIMLSASLSVDNLIIGFSLGLGDTPAIVMAAVIMAFSVSFTWLGLKIGANAKRHHAVLAEASGAAILLGMAGMDLSGWF